MAKTNIVLCLAAAVTMVIASGCADKNTEAGKKPSEKNDASQSAPDTSAGDAAGEAADTDSSQQTSIDLPAVSEYNAGELLSAALEMFGGDYTYELNVTYSDSPDTLAKLLQVSSGESFFMSVKESGGEGLAADTAYLITDGKAYDIDNNIGAYNTADPAFGSNRGLNLIANIIDMRLDRTSTRIPRDTEGLQVEEYTYTGDTYITVYDFYFDENGALKKYTATYTVEGQDELVETAEVIRLEQTADMEYFSTEQLDGLKEFAEMTEDERLGFCQELCGRYKISTDNMYELNITTDDLKRISFDGLSELVYTYATPEPKKTKASKSKKDTDNKDN